MNYLIWGTGRYASCFIANVAGIMDDVVGFVESEKSKDAYNGKPVYAAKEAAGLDYDLLLVASRATDAIEEEMRASGIDAERTVFLRRTWIPANIEDGGVSYLFDRHGQHRGEKSVFFSHFGVFTCERELADVLRRGTDGTTYWKEVDYYDTKEVISVSSAKQTQMLNEYFVPHLTGESVVCDLACASGEWSRFVAPYAGQIEGFDVSEKMIAYAKRKSEEEGIRNTDFVCTDALGLELAHTYDHFLMLGLITYIRSEEEADAIIGRVARAVKSGGMLATRDTLNISEDGTVFVYDEQAHYFCSYHSAKRYREMFERHGFSLVAEEYFYPYFEKPESPLALGSRGYIWKKN